MLLVRVASEREQMIQEAAASWTSFVLPFCFAASQPMQS